MKMSMFKIKQNSTNNLEILFFFFIVAVGLGYTGLYSSYKTFKKVGTLRLIVTSRDGVKASVLVQVKRPLGVRLRDFIGFQKQMTNDSRVRHF